MIEGAFGGFVGFLALLGGVALFLRMMRSTLSFALRAAEIASRAAVAEASARRGDLTGMSEAREAITLAKAARIRTGFTTLGWALWLVLPLVLGWVPEAWALAAPIWLLKSGSVRPQSVP